MLYLIVPPIIIVVAIAILIVFLTRSLSSKDKKNITNNNPSEKETAIQRNVTRSKTFLKTKGSNATRKLKKTLEGDKIKFKKPSSDGLSTVQGMKIGDNIHKVVSLRKKSMISHKIEDGEDRDVEEINLMKAIEANPQDSKKYESLGDYYMEHEKFDDARDCYKYVLRLDPRHKRAQVAMKNLDRVL